MSPSRRKATRAAPRRRTLARRSATGRELPARPLGFYAYRLRDVMTRRVVVARADDTLEAAASAMSRRRVSGVPVVDDRRKVVGVLSQKDIVRVLHERAGLSLPGGVFDLVLGAGRAGQADLPARCLEVLRSASVRSAMSRPALTLPPDAAIDDAIRLLIGRAFNRVPIVRRGRLVGIVTRTDLLSGSTRGPSRASGARPAGRASQ